MFYFVTNSYHEDITKINYHYYFKGQAWVPYWAGLEVIRFLLNYFELSQYTLLAFPSLLGIFIIEGAKFKKTEATGEMMNIL